jgi:hypothetical protein
MKFLTISVMIIGIIVLFNLGGITTPVTGTVINGGERFGYAMSVYTDTDETEAPLSNFFHHSIIIALLLVVTISFGIGARAGLLGSAPPIQYYLGNVAIVLMGGSVLIDMITLVTKLWSYGEGWMRAVTLLIFVPLSFAYLITLKSFWEGTDY